MHVAAVVAVVAVVAIVGVVATVAMVASIEVIAVVALAIDRSADRPDVKLTLTSGFKSDDLNFRI